jgi:hypothetical protein
MWALGVRERLALLSLASRVPRKIPRALDAGRKELGHETTLGEAAEKVLALADFRGAIRKAR